jgi:hypothetical protein
LTARTWADRSTCVYRIVICRLRCLASDITTSGVSPDSHAALRQCDKHCLDCGIRFLSAPQNAGRSDLRCPFGCAKRHRARQSNERVKAYRRTVWGKQKKDALNARRYRRPQAVGQSLSTGAETRNGSEASNSSLVENRAPALPAELSAALEFDLDGVILQESTVVHSPLLPYRIEHGTADGIDGRFTEYDPLGSYCTDPEAPRVLPSAWRHAAPHTWTGSTQLGADRVVGLSSDH